MLKAFFLWIKNLWLDWFFGPESNKEDENRGWVVFTPKETKSVGGVDIPETGEVDVLGLYRLALMGVITVDQALGLEKEKMDKTFRAHLE